MAYSEKQKIQLINTICEKISEGMALRTILKSKDMPDSVTFYKWIDADKNKLKQYVRATSERHNSIFEDIMEIADNQYKDVIITEEGKEITNHNVINRARLRIDSRKWMLSKLEPKKYGEKLDLSSDDGTMTPIIGITFDKNDER